MSESSLKDILTNSRRWTQDDVLKSRRSERIAWCIATVSMVGVISLGAAVTALVPLKEIEPFLIRVDSSTGIIDTVTSLTDAPATFDEGVKRYFLGKYVSAYENYSFLEVENNFKIVTNMSSGTVQEDYSRWISAQNPTSPQNVYGTHSTASIDIKGVQLIGENVATVRYVKRVRILSTNSVSETHWIATINFRIIPKAELSLQQRLINPIAFVVTSYRNDPEVAPK